VVEFLAHLVQQLVGPLLIVWDRLPVFRNRLVAEFVEFLEGQIGLAPIFDTTSLQKLSL
jgi:hypothetical protein